MSYIDANIIYPMFAITEKRRALFDKTGTSGHQLLDYCIQLLTEVDMGNQLLIFSDLGVLETLGIASRDIGIEKSQMILQAINRQKYIEIIQTTQTAWVTAFTLIKTVSIEGRDSLHLANALITKITIELVTCDKKFADAAIAFLRRDHLNFQIPQELQNWYQVSDEEKKSLEEQISSRVSELEIELIQI